MEHFSELYSEYKDYILIGLILIVFMLISALIFYHFESNMNKLKKEIKQKQVVEVQAKEKEQQELIVDIKGAVKTPGVYYLEKGKRVIDVVNRAGGFTKDADTSANNLSKKITDEMVIIIYTKDEIKKYLSTKEKEQSVIEKCQNDKITNDSCVDTVNGEKKEDTNTSTTSSKSTTTKSNATSSKTTDDSTSSGLISLNTASKEQLMTLTGIGESKADAIIEYRNKKKFETIEEIKEVSGIGDSLFEKIKDYITT